MRGQKKAAQEAAIGRGRGGLGAKIHATVDALGNPTGLHLTPGQVSDLDGADVLPGQIDAPTLIADKGYDAQARVIEPLQRTGQRVVIPGICTRKVQREHDRHLYKARHLIENLRV